VRQYKKYLPHLLVGGTAAGLALWWWKNSQAPSAPALLQTQQRAEARGGLDERQLQQGRDFPAPVGMPQSDMTPLQIAQAMLLAAEARAADSTLSAAEHAEAIAIQPALRSKIAALAAPAAQI
jgi:hypothetical protein